MLSFDEAFALGCRKYRELYPKGLIPEAIEEFGVLGSTATDSHIVVHITYWFEDEPHPFYLFKSSVDLATGEVNVDEAADWRLLVNQKFDTSQSL